MDDELAGVREVLDHEPDELERIGKARDDARKLLLNMLRAPWSRMTPFAITNACSYLLHPSKYDDRVDGCACGRYKDGRETTDPGWEEL